MRFLSNQNNRGHAKRELSGEDINAHVQACWHSALATAQRVKDDLPTLEPTRILEIGSSTGLNCFALQQVYPNAVVIGIEPEQEAVSVACAMRQSSQLSHPRFEQGVGEYLTLSNDSVDLIVCHTVIEHVNDVEKVISEMARVVTQTGIIHLDAPNYSFPYEPHLSIFTIPHMGKSFVKFCALIQGEWKQREFIDHLQFVHPVLLQGYFQKNGLQWHNRAIDKTYAAAKGKADIKKYRFLARLLQLAQKIGLASLLAKMIVKSRLYPSLLYTINKNSINTNI